MMAYIGLPTSEIAKVRARLARDGWPENGMKPGRVSDLNITSVTEVITLRVIEPADERRVRRYTE